MPKRNKLEIIRDMLSIIQENHKIKQTPLLRRTNLSSTRFKQYYLDLLNKELIKQINTAKGKHIILTEKGQRYIEKYQTIINFIEEFEL
jgi:predicted transcriptional regulator